MENSMTNFIMDRVDEISKNILSKNADYVEQRNVQESLIKRIQELLPEEHKHLVIKLNDAASYQAAISESIMYEYGMKDGKKI